MARPLRIEYPHAFYHITARGNERKDIFRSRGDREQFLSYLASAAERYQAVIHVYCLMSNHYHLLLETPLGNLSQIMRHINGAYTTSFNTKRRRVGHLLQGRYKAILVEADLYAQELSRCIHLNPVRAGMANSPQDYMWSSYCSYIGKRKPPDWLSRDMILGNFGRKLSEAERRYRDFVESAIRGQKDPLREVVSSTLLGSEEFVRAVREKYLKGRKAERDVPAVRKLLALPSTERVLEAVDAACKDGVLAKQVKLYLLHRYSGQKLKEIGGRFGISESGVSLASHRVKLRMGRDARIRMMIERIRKDLAL